jgi:hypothetical protein
MTPSNALPTPSNALPTPKTALPTAFQRHSNGLPTAFQRCTHYPPSYRGKLARWRRALPPAVRGARSAALPASAQAGQVAA